MSTVCVDLNTWSEVPTYTSQSGQHVCQNVTSCNEGQFSVTFASDSRNQVCQTCNGATLYQDQSDQRFCAAVTNCPRGQREFVPPNATNDRVCGPVTCPGLDPPDHGAVSTCTGANTTEPFLTECTYSCPIDKYFRPVPTHLATRVCEQNGQFSGAPYVCECFGTLKLDALNGECRSSCPEGYISDVNDPSICTECAAACGEGLYEAQACDPEEETDRVCATCNTCPYGTYAIGGLQCRRFYRHYLRSLVRLLARLLRDRRWHTHLKSSLQRMRRMRTGAVRYIWLLWDAQH